SGQGERRHDAEQGADAAAAVDGRSLLDLARDRREECAEDPDRKGEVERGISEDEGRIGVDEIEVEELAIEPDDERRRRKHLGHEHDEEERAAPRKAVARRVVRGRRGGQHDDRGRGGGDDERDAKPVRQARISQHSEEVARPRYDRSAGGRGGTPPSRRLLRPTPPHPGRRGAPPRPPPPPPGPPPPPPPPPPRTPPRRRRPSARFRGTEPPNRSPHV